MSLSTIATNINPSAGFMPGQQQQSQAPGIPTGQAPQPQPAPGTRQSVAPSPSNYNSDFDNFEDSANDVDGKLAQYKKKDDNGNDGGKPKPENQFTLPDADKFDNIAQSLAGKVQLDQEVAQKALGGDVESLNSLLSSFAQQLIKYTVHGSLATNTELSKLQRAQQVQEIEHGLTQKQRTSEVARSLGEIAPEVQSRVSQSVLNAAMQELMADYPSAPAGLLAEKLATMFGVKPGRKQAAQPQQTDWLSNFRV